MRLPDIDEALIWSVDLRRSSAQLAALWALLDEEERARARSFVFQRDYDAFVTRRGMLRRILGSALGRDPAALRFYLGPRGKPALVDDFGLRFNLSDSRDRALVALVGGGEVGIDLEAIDDRRASDEIAQHYFAPAELQDLRRQPPSARVAAFFRVWTRKEAFIKAHGGGLSIPLDAFVVPIAQSLAPTAIHSAYGGSWWLHAVAAPPGFAAALVSEGAPRRISIIAV